MNELQCKTCHKTVAAKHSQQKYCCTECSKIEKRRRSVLSVSKRRQKLKQKAVDHKGGSCITCGYMSYIGALEFHHLQPGGKDFGLSASGLTRSWEKILIEIEKCVLLCSNCHRETHAGLIKFDEEGNIK